MRVVFKMERCFFTITIYDYFIILLPDSCDRDTIYTSEGGIPTHFLVNHERRLLQRFFLGRSDSGSLVGRRVLGRREKVFYKIERFSRLT
jgi:hypothetical protein